MLKLIIPILFLIFSIDTMGQNIALNSGSGFKDLKIGDTYDQVEDVLGFGKKKSYEKYLADELFDRDPNEALECVIGFDYYIKLEYLITLPILYVYFKDDKVVQIKTTSFPEYYSAICEDVITDNNLKFWSNIDKMKQAMGKEDIFLDEEYLILKSYVYLSKGISFSTREDKVRMIHIFKPVGGSEKSRITAELQD